MHETFPNWLFYNIKSSSHQVAGSRPKAPHAMSTREERRAQLQPGADMRRRPLPPVAAPRGCGRDDRPTLSAGQTFWINIGET